MRKGENKVRNKKTELKSSSHRVIIPLYIPNEEDYYKDAFSIFKMCLHSIEQTAISPLKISVISNGCSKKINEKLFELSEQGDIDELIIETEPIGKINSILKALRTAEERLVTITDADVLFLNNWEKSVVEVFEAFPKAGMVSPVPMYRTHYRHTSNIWFDYLFSKKLKFTPVKNPDALEMFAKSIGWSYLSDKLKDVIATVESKNGVKAVVGNSHFVGTYKKEVFNVLPKQNSEYRLGGTSEAFYLDIPVLKMGGYRLATNDNFAYHMGNKKEYWMDGVYDNLKKEEKTYKDFKNLELLTGSKINYFIKGQIFKKLLYNKSFKKWVFKKKGLNRKQINTFVDAEYS